MILTWDNTTEFRCLRAFDRSDDVGLVTEAPDRDYSEYDSSDSGAATMSGSFVLSLGALFVVLLMA